MLATWRAVRGLTPFRSVESRPPAQELVAPEQLLQGRPTGPSVSENGDKNADGVQSGRSMDPCNLPRTKPEPITNTAPRDRSSLMVRAITTSTWGRKGGRQGRGDGGGASNEQFSTSKGSIVLVKKRSSLALTLLRNSSSSDTKLAGEAHM